MIHELKPYPAYKNSGVPWLGKVPEHWVGKRAKHFFREVEERSVTGEEELLSVSHITGVTPRREKNVTMFLAESNVGYKICRSGDVVINTMWAWMAALGVAKQGGLVSPSYAVYRPLQPDALLAEYLDQLLRTQAYISEYICRSTGISTSRLRLYPDQFLRILFFSPPKNEQKAIVRFLAHVDRRIRQYIRAKLKLIKLLGEQKQAIIQRGVTRGLDPNVRLKPSGIEWLSALPEHWEARRLKSIASIRYGLGQPPRESETGLPLIRATNIDHGRILEKNLVRVDRADVPKGRNAFLAAGEIIVVRSGAYTADSAMIPREYEGAVAGYDMVITARKVRPEFIALALLSSYIRDDQLIIASTRSAQPHLNAEELGVALVLLPPHSEQERILERVAEECVEIDAAMGTAHRELSLLREYRTRLIADVVTGKLDVREAAANLPAEAEESELPLGSGELAEESDVDFLDDDSELDQ